MGLCGSSVPDVIIPDPVDGEKHQVLIKPTGMLSRDQYVYQDMDKEKKWLFLDKDGGIFSNPHYYLENFVRDENKKGKVLCSAKVDITELNKASDGVSYDSDPSDYTDSDDEDDVDVITEKFKWTQKIKIKFYSDREQNTKIAEMKVKAKGKAKKVTVVTTTTNEEGEEEEHQSSTVTKKVKKIIYLMEECEGVDEMPELKMKGKISGNEANLSWESPLFEASIDGREVTVTTSWKNSALGMLAGYICAKELAPQDIADNVTIW